MRSAPCYAIDTRHGHLAHQFPPFPHIPKRDRQDRRNAGAGGNASGHDGELPHTFRRCACVPGWGAGQGLFSEKTDCGIADAWSCCFHGKICPAWPKKQEAQSMRRPFLGFMVALVMSGIVPSSAQSAGARDGGKKCSVRSDSVRYYGACKPSRSAQHLQRSRSKAATPPAAFIADPRESSGGGGGGY